MSISLKQILFYGVLVPAATLMLSAFAATILAGVAKGALSQGIFVAAVLTFYALFLGGVAGVLWLLSKLINSGPIRRLKPALVVFKPIVWVARLFYAVICDLGDLYNSNPTINLGKQKDKIPTARVI